MRGMGLTTDSIWVQLDDGEVMVVTEGLHDGDWHWVNLNGDAYEDGPQYLPPGRHTVRLGMREGGCRIDRLLFAQEDLHYVPGPADVIDCQ